MPQISGMSHLGRYEEGLRLLEHNPIFPVNVNSDEQNPGKDKKVELDTLRDVILSGDTFNLYRQYEYTLEEQTGIANYLYWAEILPQVPAILPFKLTIYAVVKLRNGREYSTTLNLEYIGKDNNYLSGSFKYSQSVNKWYVGKNNDNEDFYHSIKLVLGKHPTTGVGGDVIPIEEADEDDVLAIGFGYGTKLDGSGSIPDGFRVNNITFYSLGFGKYVHELVTNKKPSSEYDSYAGDIAINYGDRAGGIYKPVYFNGANFVPCFTIDTSGSLPAQTDSDTFYFVP